MFQKLCLYLFCIFSIKTYAVGSGFTPDGGLITQTEFAQLNFPEDLKETNLQIATSSAENPFEWAGRIQYEDNPCSGGVVALPGYRPHDRALVLTAGHCVKPNNSYLKPAEVILDQKLNGEMYFDFPRPRKIKLSNGEISEQKIIKFRRIIFASFDVVDLALIEMDETYEQLQYGTQKPPLLRHQIFEPKTKITMFGIPAAEEYESVLFHMASCQAQEVKSNSANYDYQSKEDLKYSLFQRIMTTCTLFPGMSGGYVRNQQGHVIGVNAGIYVDNYSFYADIKPILKCATPKAEFNLNCLSELKSSIEQ